ncbi:MAG: hypothetical protein PWP23_1778 [Candidatus Sumerlaeota bacterium]|nr:hypothetical protein [Candidatus Sumerlaeota bacterium]
MGFDLQGFLHNLLTLYPVFLFALTIHEVAHALTAKWAGDLTSTYQNRLSLNPMVHMDPFGTVLIPLLMMAFGGGLFFGWARPVQVDKMRYKSPGWDVIVSLAGPFSNVLLAIFGTLVFSLLLRIGLVGAGNGWWVLPEGFGGAFSEFVMLYVALNWLLVLFNLIPVPPLDGSHIFYFFVIQGRAKYEAVWEVWSRFGFVLLFLLLWRGPLGAYFGVAIWKLTRFTLVLLGFPLDFLQG